MNGNLVDEELRRLVRVHDHCPARKADDFAPIESDHQFIDPGRKKGPCPRRIDVIVESPRTHPVKNMRVLWTKISNGDWV